MSLSLYKLNIILYSKVWNNYCNPLRITFQEVVPRISCDLLYATPFGRNIVSTLSPNTLFPHSCGIVVVNSTRSTEWKQSTKYFQACFVSKLKIFSLKFKGGFQTQYFTLKVFVTVSILCVNLREFRANTLVFVLRFQKHFVDVEIYEKRKFTSRPFFSILL